MKRDIDSWILKKCEPNVMVHTCDPSTWKGEADGLCEIQTSLGYIEF